MLAELMEFFFSMLGLQQLRINESPETYRQLDFEVGALLGIIGDHNAPSTWSNDEQVKVDLGRYVIVERDYNYGQPFEPGIWDTAAYVRLTTPLATISQESEKAMVNELLLLHRYPNHFPWQDECTVFVYGLCTDGIFKTEGPYPLKFWKPQTLLLSYAAVVNEMIESAV